MAKLKKYYKVTDGGSYCVWETLEQAQQMVIDEMEYLWSVEEAVSPDHFSIEVVKMTEEEFNSLDEFEGF